MKINIARDVIESTPHLVSSINSDVNYFTVDRNGLIEEWQASTNSNYHEISVNDEITFTVYKNGTTRQVGHATVKVVSIEQKISKHTKRDLQYFVYTFYIVEKTKNITFGHSSFDIKFVDALPPTPPEEKPQGYSIGDSVTVSIDGVQEKGIIEDKCLNEYSIRTSQWRSKKWFTIDEIIDPIQQQEMLQHEEKESMPEEEYKTWAQQWHEYCNNPDSQRPQHDKMHCVKCGTVTLVAHLSDGGLCSLCCSEETTMLMVSMLNANSIEIFHKDTGVWQTEVWKNGQIVGVREQGMAVINVRDMEPLDQIEVIMIMGDESKRTREVKFLYLAGIFNRTEEHLTVIPLSMNGSVKVQWEYKIFPLSFEQWNITEYAPLPHELVEITCRHVESHQLLHFIVKQCALPTLIRHAPTKRQYKDIHNQLVTLPILSVECYKVVDLSIKMKEDIYQISKVYADGCASVVTTSKQQALKWMTESTNRCVVLKCLTDKIRRSNDGVIELAYTLLPIGEEYRNF